MKKALSITLVIVLAGLTITTGIYNYVKNQEFMSASITQVLTLAITLSIAFWATQYKADVRKTKEHAENIIRNLQLLVSDNHFYSIPTEGDKDVIQKQINSVNRKINNYLTILDEYAKMLKFKKELHYIREQFESYRTKTGDHINDLEYLSKSEKELKLIAENIDTKCNYIILNLYK